MSERREMWGVCYTKEIEKFVWLASGNRWKGRMVA